MATDDAGSVPLSRRSGDGRDRIRQSPAIGGRSPGPLSFGFDKASDDSFTAMSPNRPQARLGHQRSFATRSKTRPRHAGEGQLSGDELEGSLGSTRPSAAGRPALPCSPWSRPCRTAFRRRVRVARRLDSATSSRPSRPRKIGPPAPRKVSFAATSPDNSSARLCHQPSVATDGIPSPKGGRPTSSGRWSRARATAPRRRTPVRTSLAVRDRQPPCAPSKAALPTNQFLRRRRVPTVEPAADRPGAQGSS